MDNIKQAYQLREVIQHSRPLSQYTLASLVDDLRLRYTYHSNGIEGNTLTLNETKVIIESGITISGKSLLEHLEVNNHEYAIDFLINEVKQQAPLTARIIKEFNQIILAGTAKQAVAGKWRQEPVMISASDVQPANFYEIDDKIAALLDAYNQEKQDDNLLDLIADFHAKFEAIHPFIDGNGRTGRLLMNLELMKHGFPITIIEQTEKATYYDVLQAAQLGNDFEPIRQFIASKVVKSLMLYQRAIEQSDPALPAAYLQTKK